MPTETGSERDPRRCPCCGARLKRDRVGHYCGMKNCKKFLFTSHSVEMPTEIDEKEMPCGHHVSNIGGTSPSFFCRLCELEGRLRDLMQALYDIGVKEI